MKTVDRNAVLDYLKRMFSHPASYQKPILEDANWQSVNWDDDEEVRLLRLELDEIMEEVWEAAAAKVEEIRNR